MSRRSFRGFMCNHSDTESRDRLDELLVDIAPAPVLSGLEAAHDGMLRLVKVPRCVTVWRIVAATDMPAIQTQTEMQPCTSGGETLLTAVRRPWLLAVNSLEVLTSR